MIFLMQGWADFVDWLGGGPAAQALAAFVTLLVTVALAAITFSYAVAARRQADASAKMAEEMRGQRLDLDRPYLLLEVRNLDALEWKDLNEPSAAEPDPAAAYPKSIAYRVYNAGRGPAKEVETTFLQPLMAFEGQKRDVLMPGDFWDVEVQASELLAALRAGTTGGQLLGMEHWMKAQGIHSPFYGAAYDCGLMVGCTDIHDRRWATYLKFVLAATTDIPRRVVDSRTLWPVEHRIVQLEEDDDPRSHRCNR